jgi:threonine synthase
MNGGTISIFSHSTDITCDKNESIGGYNVFNPYFLKEKKYIYIYIYIHIYDKNKPNKK